MVEALKKLSAIAKTKKGKLVSKSYLGMREKYLFRCSKGHEWYARGSSIKAGTWCPSCNERKKNKKSKFKETCKLQNIKILNWNEEDQMTIICKKGHITHSLYKKLRLRKKLCKLCISSNWLNYEDLKKKIQKYKLNNRQEYLSLTKNHSYPSRPELVYKNEWVNWNDFLGSKIRISQESKVKFLERMVKRSLHNLNKEDKELFLEKIIQMIIEEK